MSSPTSSLPSTPLSSSSSSLAYSSRTPPPSSSRITVAATATTIHERIRKVVTDVPGMANKTVTNQDPVKMGTAVLVDATHANTEELLSQMSVLMASISEIKDAQNATAQRVAISVETVLDRREEASAAVQSPRRQESAPVVSSSPARSEELGLNEVLLRIIRSHNERLPSEAAPKEKVEAMISKLRIQLGHFKDLREWMREMKHQLGSLLGITNEQFHFFRTIDDEVLDQIPFIADGVFQELAHLELNDVHHIRRMGPSLLKWAHELPQEVAIILPKIKEILSQIRNGGDEELVNSILESNSTLTDSRERTALKDTLLANLAKLNREEYSRLKHTLEKDGGLLFKLRDLSQESYEFLASIAFKGAQATEFTEKESEYLISCGPAILHWLGSLTPEHAELVTKLSANDLQLIRQGHELDTLVEQSETIIKEKWKQKARQKALALHDKILVNSNVLSTNPIFSDSLVSTLGSNTRSQLRDPEKSPLRYNSMGLDQTDINILSLFCEENKNSKTSSNDKVVLSSEKIFEFAERVFLAEIKDEELASLKNSFANKVNALSLDHADSLIKMRRERENLLEKFCKMRDRKAVSKVVLDEDFLALFGKVKLDPSPLWNTFKPNKTYEYFNSLSPQEIYRRRLQQIKEACSHCPSFDERTTSFKSYFQTSVIGSDGEAPSVVKTISARIIEELEKLRLLEEEVAREKDRVGRILLGLSTGKPLDSDQIESLAYQYGEGDRSTLSDALRAGERTKSVTITECEEYLKALDEKRKVIREMIEEDGGSIALSVVGLSNIGGVLYSYALLCYALDSGQIPWKSTFSTRYWLSTTLREHYLDRFKYGIQQTTSEENEAILREIEDELEGLFNT